MQQAKIPVIGPESTSKEIVSPFPKYVWATECTYPNQADVAVAYAIKKLGTKNFTAVGLGGNVASADAYLDQVKARVQKAGGTYKETVHYEYTAPNLDQQAQKIAADKPDVIFTHGGTAQNVLAFKSLAKYGVTNTLTIGIFAQETDPIAQASPKVGAHYYAVNCYSNAKQSDVPGVADMVAAAKAAGYGPDIYNATDFTNGYVNGLLIDPRDQTGRRQADPRVAERGHADDQELRHPGAVAEHHLRPGQLGRRPVGPAVQVQLLDQGVGAGRHLRRCTRSATRTSS